MASSGLVSDEQLPAHVKQALDCIAGYVMELASGVTAATMAPMTPVLASPMTPPGALQQHKAPALASRSPSPMTPPGVLEQHKAAAPSIQIFMHESRSVVYHKYYPASSTSSVQVDSEHSNRNCGNQTRAQPYMHGSQLGPVSKRPQPSSMLPIPS